jgi:hypothetical protein
MKQYYLAHHFTMRHKIREIQKDLEYYFSLTLINPFYDLNRTDIEILDKGLWVNRTIPECNELVIRDLSCIDDCDGLICMEFDEGSIGSFMEIMYAWLHDKPIYIISSIEHIRNHSWIRAICFKIFSSVDEFKDYLKVNGKDMQ